MSAKGTACSSNPLAKLDTSGTTSAVGADLNAQEHSGIETGTDQNRVVEYAPRNRMKEVSAGVQLAAKSKGNAMFLLP